LQFAKDKFNETHNLHFVLALSTWNAVPFGTSNLVLGRAKCHKVLGEGKEVGPDLSEIGSKLSREEMFVAILNPSAAVSHNYETYSVLTTDGVVLTGTKIDQTDMSITIRSAEASETNVKTEDIEQLEKQSTSLMPEGLHKIMPLQSLIDLVDYIVLLRKPEEQGFNLVTRKRPTPQSEEPTSREPKDALSGLAIAEGVELQLFSSEPMMLSPTSMDVDHLGRVWIAEAVNYRHFRNKTNEERVEGDRIIVMEDADHDGKADKLTFFYQGPEIDSPHGVCVLGNQVIVSAGANVWVFTDADDDLIADTARAWMKMVGKDWNSTSGRDILWRSRSRDACEYLTKIVFATNDPADQARYFRAMDFHDAKKVERCLTQSLSQ
jgi:putative heme-binding domain-containing protein